MQNGHDERLADRFSGMVLNHSFRTSDNDDSKNESLFQVLKAVESAEATIRQQVEENNRLRVELQSKIQELEKYKSDEKSDESTTQQQNLGKQLNEIVHKSYEANLAAVGSVDDHARENLSEGSMNNGIVKGPQRSIGHVRFPSPSTTSMSPIRTLMDGEPGDTRIDLSTHGPLPVAGVNNSNSMWKQDLVHQIREHEEEILQLRRHLTDYSVKEAQIRNEKYVLEKRISYMRLAFDQQQQDLVDAASKALSYRQEIIEENIRLTYALQAAQQERSTFVSSLVPLLAEYSLQPQVSDAQSLVSSVKVLFRHLQEKLLLTESMLKQSEYQLEPWRSDANQMNVASTSAARSVGTELAVSAAKDWDMLHPHHVGAGGSTGRNIESDEPGMYAPPLGRNTAAHELSEQLDASQDEFDGERPVEATKKVKFHEHLSKKEMDAENQSSAVNPVYSATYDDPSGSNSPFLQPVLEDPSSSYSEAAEDDPLPAIEDLQITGEAFPGRILQASGYSTNGTTSCNFEWVRHMEDGSVNYIEEAKQPSYLVSADDVDAYLAIEVQPLDDRKRKGELVKVYANEQQKIGCDPEMQTHIEKSFNSGQASYKVSITTGHFDIWEPCTLSVKREGYSIKSNSSSGLNIAEKFSQSNIARIPFGKPTEFVIFGSDDAEHLLRVDDVTTEVSCSRDTIVLTLRLFAMMAKERRKGKKKKKGFLFNK